MVECFLTSGKGSAAKQEYLKTDLDCIINKKTTCLCKLELKIHPIISKSDSMWSY